MAPRNRFRSSIKFQGDQRAHFSPSTCAITMCQSRSQMRFPRESKMSMVLPAFDPEQYKGRFQTNHTHDAHHHAQHPLLRLLTATTNFPKQKSRLSMHFDPICDSKLFKSHLFSILTCWRIYCTCQLFQGLFIFSPFAKKDFVRFENRRAQISAAISGIHFFVNMMVLWFIYTVASFSQTSYLVVSTWS